MRSGSITRVLTGFFLTLACTAIVTGGAPGLSLAQAPPSPIATRSILPSTAPPNQAAKALENFLAGVPGLRDKTCTFVLGVDASGSMTKDNKIDKARQAVQWALEQSLVPGDRVVGFRFGGRPETPPFADLRLKPTTDPRDASIGRGEASGKFQRYIKMDGTGTDLGRAQHHALETFVWPNRDENHLVLFLSDNFQENASFLNDPKNRQVLSKLEAELQVNLGTESNLGDELTLSYYKHFPPNSTNPRITPLVGSVAGQGASLRQQVVQARSPGTSATSTSTGSGAQKPSPSPSPIINSEGREEGGGPFPILIALGALGLVGGLGFLVMLPKPITITDPSGESQTFQVSMNNPLQIGGQGGADDKRYSLPNLPVPIAEVSLGFPGRVRIAKRPVEGLQIALEEGIEVEEAPQPLASSAVLNYHPPGQYLATTLVIARGGQPRAEGDGSATGAQTELDDWR